MAMNKIEGTGKWTGLSADVVTDPKRAFGFFNKNGSIITSMRLYPMRVSHMVVVDGTNAGRVIIRDPASATKYMMKWDEFVKHGKA